MSISANNSLLLRAIALAALTVGSVASTGVAFADDTPPTDNPAHGGRHNHDPAWAA